ncbi:LOW QUALITY PROTEIN: uncharacterized protein LOC102809562, partial [Saccoglossus kowalevskii]
NNSSVCVPQELPCEDLESPMNFMAHYSTTNLHLVAAVVHSEIRNHYFVLTKRNMSEWIMYDDSKISVFTMTGELWKYLQGGNCNDSIVAAFYALNNVFNAEPVVDLEALKIALERLKLKVASESWISRTGLKTQEVFDAVDETLKDIIGLESIKRSIKSIIRRHSLNLLRKAVGGNPREEPMNFLFLGGPGTCKTTVARKLAGCLNLAGIIDKNITIEVQRDDLVGAHIGQSEEKTNKVIHSAKGGILFIDEAYTLFKARRVNDFGVDAINTLMKYMNNDIPTYSGSFPIIILSGYTQQMEIFLNSNPGLRRRFRTPWYFPDYNPAELSNIFVNECMKQGFILESYCQHRDFLTKAFSMFPLALRSAMNGSLCTKLLTSIKDCIDSRLEETQITHCSNISIHNTLNQITNDDIMTSVSHMCTSVREVPCMPEDTQTNYTTLETDTQTDYATMETNTQTDCTTLETETQTDYMTLETDTQTDY